MMEDEQRISEGAFNCVSMDVDSDSQIPISRYARQVISVLMREMGF